MKLRWREFIVAFLMALVLWYGVSGSEKVETQVDVRVDYRGLPQGLIVRSGMVNKISVRVRASLGMLRSIANRDFAFFMDLSTVHKGENTLPIPLAYIPFRSGIEVIDSSPSRIFLDVDTLERKKIPLKAQINGVLPQDYVAQVTFTPPEVILSGPSSVLEDMASLLVPVQVDETAVLGATESTRLLPLEEGTDASPSEAKVMVHIGIKRKLVKVARTVQVSVSPSVGKFVRPDKVTVAVAIPESLAAKAPSNNEIKAFVRLPANDLGSYTLPVQVSLPEGAELVEIDPPHITVTLEQKQPPPKK